MFSFRLLLSYFITLSVIALIGLGLYTLWQYPIKNIELTHDDENTIGIEAVNQKLHQILGQSWLQLSPTDLEQTLQQMPWIDSVSIEKTHLGHLLVQINQQIPLFRWRDGYLISHKGNVFEVDSKQWQRHQTLPHLETSETNFRLPENLAAIVNPSSSTAFFQHFGNLKSLQINSFTLKFKYQKNTLITNNTHAVKTLQRFQTWVERFPANTIQAMQKNTHIDLRYENGFALVP